MPQTISFTLSVRVAGGPALAVDRQLTVDAYDMINVDLDPATPGTGSPPGAPTPSSITVPVQPGAAAQMQLLLITSTVYDAQLTYTQGDTNPVVELDVPQVLMGSGLIALLGADPQNITFSNALPQPVTVTILVGRSAP